MLKNPYINALIAGGYIVLLVLTVSSSQSFVPVEESILFPMIMLSVLVLSAALMAILFFYEPVRLLLEGQKEEALKFFGKTLSTFALFVLALAVIVLSL